MGTVADGGIGADIGAGGSFTGDVEALGAGGGNGAEGS